MPTETYLQTLQTERSQLVVKSNELIQKSRFNLSTSNRPTPNFTNMSFRLPIFAVSAGSRRKAGRCILRSSSR